MNQYSYDEIRCMDDTYHTPMYVFHEADFMERYGELQRAAGEDISICYSLKANPFLVDFIKKQGGMVETCSGGEFELCLQKGMNPEKITAGGIFNSRGAYGKICRLPIARVSVESMEQLIQLNQAAQNAGRRVRVVLRLTSGNQFGMECHELINSIRKRRDYPYLYLAGIHYYRGTGRKDRAEIDDGLRDMGEALHKLAGIDDFTLEELVYGPGIGYPYFIKDSIREYEDLWEYMLAKLKAVMPRKVKMTLEIGRFLAAGCGEYITRVEEIRMRGDQSIVIVNGGTHQCSYYRQIAGSPAPYIEAVHRRAGGNKKHYAIVGSLCSAMDILVKNMICEELSCGDYIVFRNTGAYSMTDCSSLFLSRTMPAVLVNGTDGVRILRKPMESYKLNMGE